jgi:hypothetical protein
MLTASTSASSNAQIACFPQSPSLYTRHDMASLQAFTLSSTAPLARGAQRSSRVARARGVAVTTADLFGGVSRFFSSGGDHKSDDTTARIMTQQLASSAQAEVRLLADFFNTEATSTLSPQEAQRRIAALLNGADRDAASKARSASNILGRYDGGEDGMNRMAVAAAKDEIKWSKKFTLSLDVNQNRAEKLVRRVWRRCASWTSGQRFPQELRGRSFFSVNALSVRRNP